jgi:hypothetical protein
MGFEPTIAASERAKAVYVLDRSATVTGGFQLWEQKKVCTYVITGPQIQCVTILPSYNAPEATIPLFIAIFLTRNPELR